MQGHDPEAAKFLIKPDDPLLSLTRLISQNDVVTLRDVRRSSPPRTEATCFHTVLAGSGHLQVRQTEKGGSASSLPLIYSAALQACAFMLHSVAHRTGTGTGVAGHIHSQMGLSIL